MEEASHSDDAGGRISAVDLLAQVQTLVEEANPSLAARVRVELHSSLDRDLGLDSLSRVELIARLERRYAVRLPEQLVAEAQTPAELLSALGAAAQSLAPEFPGAAPVPAMADGGAGEALVPLPAATSSLVQALAWHGEHAPRRAHVHLYGEDGQITTLSYGQLYRQSRQVAAGLQQYGFEPGDAVAIMLPTGVEYLSSFMGIQMAGGIPVPIYPPARPKQIEDHFRRHARILDNAETKFLITFDRVKQVSRLLKAQTASVKKLLTHEELLAGGAGVQVPLVNIGGDHIAFIQYTSGSTGDPKGVVLTQTNLLASIRCMARALQVTDRDVFVSWLPLYHDMGLIGAWLGALVTGFPVVLMSPLSFLHRPVEWLRVIQTFGGSLSGGPNFAYELCLRRIEDVDLQGLDLSSWRIAFNGAEPVSQATLERFSERFAACGFDQRAMTPVYGLAEATLGVAFTPTGRGPRVDRISREVLYSQARAKPVVATEAGLDLVSCGVPIPEFEARIVDQHGHELPDRAEGEVEFKGPGVTRGYYRNPPATRELLHGDWRRSGDRGYLADGELYLTGRDKDVVIRAGRNLYPYALEQAIADIPGVRRGCVAVFGSMHPHDGSERLVVVAESREPDAMIRADIQARIENLALEHLGLAADDVILAPPQTILKTSSGKIRRAALARLYTRGELIARQRPVWQQLLRLGAGSIAAHGGRMVRRTTELAYVGWIALLVPVLAVLAWPLLVAMPGENRRHGFARFSARLLLWLAGVRVRGRGFENLPAAGPWVLVSNHQSYLDGFVLTALLPANIQFVAKAEFLGSFIARTFLRAIGCLFVERFDKQRSVADSQHIVAALGQGRTVGFFVEGTFHRMPGLLPFQSGAFEAAVHTGAPLVPVVIRGSRNVLRGDEFFVRPGCVDVQILAPESVPCVAAGDHWRAATALRLKVRARMLEVCGEPDLADRNALAALAQYRARDAEHS